MELILLIGLLLCIVGLFIAVEINCTPCSVAVACLGFVIALLLLSIPPEAQAREEMYLPYFKATIGNTLRDPSKLIYQGKEYNLYPDSNKQYALEAGYSYPLDNGDALSIGVAYTDLLHKSEYHDSKIVEPFLDYTWNFKYGIFYKWGSGIKFNYDKDISLQINGVPHKIYYERNPFLDKISARVAFGIRLQNWEVSLGHRSQYFSGKPLNDAWEYSTTTLDVGVVFK